MHVITKKVPWKNFIKIEAQISEVSELTDEFLLDNNELLQMIFNVKSYYNCS